jgi:hypothetical protein
MHISLKFQATFGQHFLPDKSSRSPTKHALFPRGLSPVCKLFYRPRFHYVKNDFLATVRFFCGAAGDGAAPTVMCSGAQTPAAPTNGTVGAAGDTSRPYKWGLICRGGSITSRPWSCYL